MITEDELKAIEHIAESSTDTGMVGGYGPMHADAAFELADKTNPEDRRLWSAYVKRADGDYIIAITGNGPDSESNARFFSGARSCILALISEIRRLRDERVYVLRRHA